MKRLFKLLIIGVGLLTVVGCANVYLSANTVDKPVMMNVGPQKDFEIVKHFQRPLRAYFAIFDLVTISNPEVERVVEEEIKSVNGDAVINLKIHGQTSVIDAVIPIALGVIGGMIAPPYGSYAHYLIGARTYTVEGDVIKSKK